MITLGIKAPDRDTAIQFLRDRGIILDYAPEVTEDVPDTWAVKLAATFDKDPSLEDIAGAMEKVLIPAHTRVTEPEKIVFDKGVHDVNGLNWQKNDPFISRVLTKAVLDAKGDVVTPEVKDPNFYMMIVFADGKGGLDLAALLDVGGTINSKFKLAARAELTAEAVAKGETLVRKEALSRIIGAVTVFKIDGENGVSSEELGRKYL